MMGLRNHDAKLFSRTAVPPSGSKHLSAPNTIEEGKGNFSSDHQQHQIPSVELATANRTSNKPLPVHSHPQPHLALPSPSAAAIGTEAWVTLGQQGYFLWYISHACRISVSRVSIISCISTTCFTGARCQIHGGVNTQPSARWRTDSPFCFL